MNTIYFKGYYGNKNLGDDIFMIAAEYLLSIHNSNYQAYFMGNNLPNSFDGKSKVANIKSRLLLKLYELVIMSKVDKIAYFGGSLFEDAGTNFKEIKFLMRKINLFNSKLCAYGVSLGPFSNDSVGEEVKDLIQRFSYIGVRDFESVDLIEKFDMRVNHDFVFDPAILLRSMYPDLVKKNYIQHDTSTKKVFGISLCKYESYKNGDTEKEVERENALFNTMLKLVENKQVEKFVFYVFNGDDNVGDKQITEEFSKRFIGKVPVQIVNYDSNSKSMLESISRCDMILGIRLHSGIIAYSFGIPFLLIEYHNKCTEFLNTINHSSRFDLDNCEKNYNTIISILGSQDEKMIEPKYFEKKFVEMSKNVIK